MKIDNNKQTGEVTVTIRELMSLNDRIKEPLNKRISESKEGNTIISKNTSQSQSQSQ